MDKTAQRYLNEVRRALPCPKEDRDRLLTDAEAMLDSFAQENPNAFYSDYVNSFGPPKDFAQEIMSQVDPEVVHLYRQRRKRIALAILLVLAALAVFLLGRWSQAGRSEPTAPPVETVTPTTELTPEPAQTDTPAPAETDGGPDYAAYLEQFYTDAADIQYKPAVATLAALHVWDTGASEFQPGKTVTRAMAARLLTATMCGGELPTDLGVKDTPTFSDIRGHWAEAYIEYCADLGIITGDSGGNFDPEGEINAFAFIKMLLGALGYDANAYRLTGDTWAVRADELARVTGLYGGFESLNSNAPLTYDAASQFLYNALQATPKVVVPLQTGGEVSWQYQDATHPDGTPRTLLRDRFNIELDEIEF